MKGLPRADKNFGQHFLVNVHTIDKITTPPDDFDVIIEVGPGPGVLTKKLPQENLYLVEKDKRFREILETIVGTHRLFMVDALDFDFNQLPGNKVWLVSNLPYNISAPLTINFLQLAKIKTMTLMYQKEVASKILAREDMNSLGVLCQNYFIVSSLVKVSPGSFSPPPKVQSEVLTFVRRDEPAVSIAEFFTFEAFLRNLYREKRKTLFNNLKKICEPLILKEKLANLGLSESIRAERLLLDQVIKLYIALKDHT